MECDGAAPFEEVPLFACVCPNGRRISAKSAVGPWNLGRWSPIIGWLGVLWVAIITVLFMLPEVSPVNRDSFNYAPVAVGVVLAFSGIYWLVSARKWFKGRRAQGDEAELQQIESTFMNVERELEAVD